MPTKLRQQQIEEARRAPVKLTKRHAEVLRMLRESRDIAMAAKVCGRGLLFGI